ncbi:MAG TPA: sugar transferase, partial [Anaerolineales bacterium]|nr:sugar transferase [Anaerolineales bacterium]
APTPTPLSKRLFDLCLACLGLLISAPVWLAGGFLIWFEDPGPVFFVKNSVGKDGHSFRQYKFRTMVRGAENETGPIMAQVGDQRVLRFGRFMRKTALDELPQLINILSGQMSFVGPRPQRTVLVLGYLQQAPEYAGRHRVLPGLAGLAQVAGDYFLTPRQKLRFDCLYIRYSSVGYDLRLIGLAFLIAFWFRWQKDWDGKLPRPLLHAGRPRR